MGSLVTRFAPSPTGQLHKGHAFSALSAFCLAQERNGRFLVRIEDIDSTRCTRDKAEGILDDLAWLGLRWEQPVRYQSEHLADYSGAIRRLSDMGVLYPCFCTRSDILHEIEQAGQAPHGGDVPVYPGICRQISEHERQARLSAGVPHALRLDLEKALSLTGSALYWQDSSRGRQIARPELLGDAVLARKDIGASYHLAVVVDDGLQGVTDIVRGEDLFDATHLHRVLQALLGLPVPTYHHHPLLTDSQGHRLAKRDRAVTLHSLREAGLHASELRRELGFRDSFFTEE